MTRTEAALTAVKAELEHWRLALDRRARDGSQQTVDLETMVDAIDRILDSAQQAHSE